MAKSKAPNGPIPGENYLANTKNFPWHRPPDETDFVKVIERTIENLIKPEKQGMIMTMLDSGETVLDVTAGLLRVAVGKGQVSIDTATLAAGPVAKLVETIGNTHKVKVRKGYDVGNDIPTPERRDLLSGKALRRKPMKPDLPPPPVEAEPEGMMAPMKDQPASKNVQNAMLGYGDEGMTDE